MPYVFIGLGALLCIAFIYRMVEFFRDRDEAVSAKNLANVISSFFLLFALYTVNDIWGWHGLGIAIGIIWAVVPIRKAAQKAQ